MQNNQSDNSILELLGIKADDGKIEIDTNKAKSFFETLQTTVEKKVEELNKSVQEGKVDLKDTLGIKIEDEKIELDLKKTKNFLEEIANKAKSFVEMIDDSVSKFGK